MSSFLKTSRRLTRKIEATVKKEEEKESRGGPGEPVLRLLLLLPSWSSSAIIFPFFFSLFLYLALFRPTFSTGNQARIRYRRISPINLLLFSSLLFLCFFYSLSRIRSDSSRYPRCLISPCLRFSLSFSITMDTEIKTTRHQYSFESNIVFAKFSRSM